MTETERPAPALERLAQAVLDGRVHFEVTDTHSYGERNGSYVTVYVDPEPTATTTEATR